MLEIAALSVAHVNDGSTVRHSSDNNDNMRCFFIVSNSTLMGASTQKISTAIQIELSNKSSLKKISMSNIVTRFLN